MPLPWPHLNIDEVLAINAAMVGPGQLRDRALLESAVARPAMTAGGVELYETVHDQAAALMHSLARNHAFVDGNKRTALLATVVFYRRCGYSLDMAQEAIEDLVVEVAQGSYEVGAISGTLKQYAAPSPPPEDEPPVHYE